MCMDASVLLLEGSPPKTTGKKEDRKVLTTRNDGGIYVSVVNGKDLYIAS